MNNNFKINFQLTGPEIDDVEAVILKRCLDKITFSLKEAEQRLNTLDSGCGDGDCGTTLRHFVEGKFVMFK